MVVRPKRIVIAGGSGRLGTLLRRHFQDQGHEPAILGRRACLGERGALVWNGAEMGPWAAALEGADVLINLAGHTLNCRYTAANRREILSSRTRTTELIGCAVERNSTPPKLWINASSSAIYPPCSEQAFDEDSAEQAAGNQPETWAFSMRVAREWERALFEAKASKTRRVALRMVPVMTPEAGGVFDVLLHMVRLGAGGTCGSGRQYAAWIHAADFVRAVDFLIEREDLEGPVNVCSPAPVPNREFMRRLRRAWCTTYVGVPLPEWALSACAAVLRTETEILLKSRRIVPKRLLDAGFDFHFPNWRGAAADLVRRWRELHPDE